MRRWRQTDGKEGGVGGRVGGGGMQQGQVHVRNVQQTGGEA